MLNLNNAESTATGNVRIPRDSYGLVCVEAEFKRSMKKGTPMIELTFEIASPESLLIGNDKVKIAGLKVRKAFFLTQKALGILTEFHRLMGIPLAEIDETNDEFMNAFVSQYLGCGAEAILSSRENVQKKETLNPDGTISEGPMLDDNGNPIVSYQVEIYQFRKARPDLKVPVPA